VVAAGPCRLRRSAERWGRCSVSFFRWRLWLFFLWLTFYELCQVRILKKIADTFFYRENIPISTKNYFEVQFQNMVLGDLKRPLLLRDLESEELNLSSSDCP
jgi:hypothetical protein